MGQYLETLTRLFLAGSFPQRTVETAAPEPARAAAPDLLASPPPRPPPDEPPAPPEPTATPMPAPIPREKEMTHPGQILAQHLIDLGLTASDLARDIGVPVNRVTAIINGQRGVTADTALRLGHWFGVEPEIWLELQMRFELDVARRELGAKLRRMPSLLDRVA
jgi:addiction module HigA family antidote